MYHTIFLYSLFFFHFLFIIGLHLEFLCFTRPISYELAVGLFGCNNFTNTIFKL